MKCWITNTIKNVIIVVLELINKFQSSEKLKNGPVNNHTATSAIAKINEIGLPVIRVMLFASLENFIDIFEGGFICVISFFI